MFWWGQGATSRAQDWGKLTWPVLRPQKLVMHARGSLTDVVSTASLNHPATGTKLRFSGDTTLQVQT